VELFARWDEGEPLAIFAIGEVETRDWRGSRAYSEAPPWRSKSTWNAAVLAMMGVPQNVRMAL